jgi:hypothetical protein
MSRNDRGSIKPLIGASEPTAKSSIVCTSPSGSAAPEVRAANRRVGRGATPEDRLR